MTAEVKDVVGDGQREGHDESYDRVTTEAMQRSGWGEELTVLHGTLVAHCAAQPSSIRWLWSGRWGGPQAAASRSR